MENLGLVKHSLDFRAMAGFVVKQSVSQSDNLPKRVGSLPKTFEAI
jgi:hypothetical protein